MMNKKETSRLGLAKYLLILPVIAALLFFNNCKSTKNTATPKKETATVRQLTETEVQPMLKKATSNSVGVYDHVEEMPVFPGGINGLIKWLSENIVYPVNASKDSIQGRVVVRFVVRSDGVVDNAEVIQSLNPDCDAEAVRAVQAMPTWTPGKQKGEPVAVYYMLPIAFKLSPTKTEKPAE